jgi:chaperonin GroES
MELEVGEKVAFSQFGGNDIEYDGEEYTLMNQSDILAVIE